MPSFNKVILIGNLTKDPEIHYTPSGTAVANFSLAVNRRYKQGDEVKEEVCFVDIVVFGKQAENSGKYLSKGRGGLSTDAFSNADGRATMVRSEANTKSSPNRLVAFRSGRGLRNRLIRVRWPQRKGERMSLF